MRMKGFAVAVGGVLSLALTASAERSVTMFVAFTGKPTATDIERKLDALATGGVDSFMLYPTSGLGYEYLGKEFFEATRAFASGARKRGMKMWLYDEHNWPSGSCLGRVPAADKAFREWQLALVADGTNASWRKVLSPVTTSSMCTGGFKKGWPNLLEPRAVDLFTRLTHDAYARELAPWFADGTIRGIFMDEPFHQVPGSWLPKGTVRAVRWYEGLEEDYAALTGGRDFRRDAEDWFRGGRLAKKAGVWADYNTVYARRFRSAFFDRIRAKTDELGILATGHLISEHNPIDSTALNGDPLESLAGLSFPGMDEIRTKTEPDKIEWLTLHTVQYAIRRNRRGGMVELYACGPANMPPAKFLKMLRICALHGVTRYFTVMSAMDASWMDEMHGFTTGMGEQQPWFAEFPSFMDAADAASAMAAKRAVFDVALRFPRRQCALAAAGAASVPDVNGFLGAFELSQVGVELIREEDETKASAVFAFEGTGLREQRSGQTFSNVRAALDWTLRHVPERFVLKDARGVREPNVLVRNYEDGTHAFERLGRTPAEQKGGRTEQVPGEWKLSLGATPTLRLPFDRKGVCRLKLDVPLKGLRLATRGVAVRVDGRGVAVSNACDWLRPSFNELYRTSEPFDLAAGKHEFQLPDKLRDQNWYLPAAFLSGDFSEKDGVLSACPSSVATGALADAGLAGFCGAATYSRKVDVPKGKFVALELDVGGHFARVKLDGHDLGAIGWGNYSWTVPDGLQGKSCELAITVYTSLVPLFGAANPKDASYWGSTEPVACGLLKPPAWRISE